MNQRFHTARIWSCALGFYVLFYGIAHAQTEEIHRLNLEINEMVAARKFHEALPLVERALQMTRAAVGENPRFVCPHLGSLANIKAQLGRYDEAETLYNQITNLCTGVADVEEDTRLTLLDNQGLFYAEIGRFTQAKEFIQRVYDLRVKKLGNSHQDVGTALHNLAYVYYLEGHYGEAEPLEKRAIAILENTRGRYHPSVATALNNLAFIYFYTGRFAETGPLLERSLEIRKEALGPDSPQVGETLNNLATLYHEQGQLEKAVELLLEALPIFTANLGPNHPHVATILNNAALILRDQNKYHEAELLYRREEEILKKAYGEWHHVFAFHLANLALVVGEQGRFEEARQLFERAIAIDENILGDEHWQTIQARNNFAFLYLDQQRWQDAFEQFVRASDAWTRYSARKADVPGQALSGAPEGGSEVGGAPFIKGLLKAGCRLRGASGTNDQDLMRQAFVAAQGMDRSRAARSLTQMAARGARNDPVLAKTIRERQDLAVEWAARDKLLVSSLSNPVDKRDPAAEQELRNRLAALDARIKEIDKELAAKFPDYAALANPAPLAAEEVREQLGPDEALVLFLDTEEWKPTPEETFIWVVTKTDLRWVRSELGTPALTREVAALRCGLDAAAWDSSRCAELTGRSYTAADRKAGKLLPFDHTRAYDLYKALFGQVEDLIKGKNLLIVPSGPLTQLPFQVLVTAAPASGDHKSVAWLVRDHALSVLPAVSSLKALRRVARPSAAKKPMIGFGNPLLDGNPDDPVFGEDDKKRAQDARDFKRCPAPQRVASNEESHRGVAQLATRGGLASVSQIRFQAPLPETAGELCAVARDLNADPADIYLGARATEREVKRLSEDKSDARLSNYRIVHFATHGALAGQVSGSNEPGLLLTPPDVPSEEDDGYLTASEIAALKLDADWVILSACNTAASGAEGAEALSGLARAFIYAQARALLVSHWAVKSGATVKLVTGAMSRLAADKSMGRAEAMRQSMLALIDNGTPREAHPAYWAPFVVVGEGAAAR